MRPHPAAHPYNLLLGNTPLHLPGMVEEKSDKIVVVMVKL